MDNKELVSFCDEQIELEAEIIRMSTEIVKTIDNPVVRELIAAISIDSTKHRSLLTALKAIYSKSTPFVEEAKASEIAENIKKHIDLEAKAIETYKQLLDKLTDEKAKTIIQAIYADELRHHALLQKIYKNIVEKETLTEKDMYDWLWDDAIAHGSPGG